MSEEINETNENATEESQEAVTAEAAEGNNSQGDAKPEASAEGSSSTEEEKLYAGKYKTIEALEKGYGELSKKMGMPDDEKMAELEDKFKENLRKDVPSDPGEYEFAAPEGLLPEGAEISFQENNPIMGEWQKKAHEIGLSPTQFNEITALYVKNELAMVPDSDTEHKKLGENSQLRIDRVDLWCSKNLSKESYQAVHEFSGEAQFIVAMEELIKKTGQNLDAMKDISVGDGPLTRKDLENMMRKKEYRDPRFRDESFVRKVQEGFQQLSQQN